MNGRISPSMMCAAPDRLPQTLEIFEAEGIEFLHIDIMDGVFVPNFTLGTDYCKSMKKLCSVPLDIHLMITSPEKKISWFPAGQGDIVSVHIESTDNLSSAIDEIKKTGAKAFVAINPATPAEVLLPYIFKLDGVLVMCVNPGFAGQKLIPETLGKITEVRKMLDEAGRADVSIEVDGNVSFENAEKMRAAGADIFVAGTSSVFTPEMTLREGIAKFRGRIF